LQLLEWKMAFTRTLPSIGLAAVLMLGTAHAQPETNATHALLLDYDSGEQLFCKNCSERMTPSSMSKLMTVELVFQRLKDGRLKLTDTFHVSENAWRQGQTTNESKMWVAVNSDISVDNLLKGIIVQSGGDACIVVAEALAGSEAAFAEMMNARAKELGLLNSHFANSSGLPDPEHYMSAEDLAKLAAHVIRDYPEYYSYFDLPEFTWSNIRQPNRNTLIGPSTGVDGLKTGHTEEAGYGITASSVRDGRRLVLVINGLKSERERIAEGRRLLDLGYREYKRYDLLSAGDAVGEAELWGGAKNTVALTVKDPVRVLMPIAGRGDLKVTLSYTGPIRAPVEAGQEIAALRVSVPGKQDKIVPLVAAESVDSSGFFDNMIRGLVALLFGPDEVG
jgi:D-alanyl-D-alanine carboxypeptidase (penicillin-binding protein 5/6)